MKKKLLQLGAVFLATIALTATADELTNYVQTCESTLGFTADQVPTLDCNDGVFFKGTGVEGSLSNINDFVNHARINASVDLVVACRWLQHSKPLYSQKAVSVELLIHNRFNGATCFFAAKDPNPPAVGKDPRVSTTILSPTDVNASSYWMQPADLNAKTITDGNGSPPAPLRCVGCHVAGPYIASVDIAPALAQFGLLNDGHDTFAARYFAVLPPPRTDILVGLSSFWIWNNIIRAYNSTTTCANGCHSIGLKSTALPLMSSEDGEAVVPSLQNDIAAISSAGVMPANNPLNQDSDNSYNWVNMGSSLSDSGDFETLDALHILYPKFWCSNPVSVEAHAVDQDVGYSFRTNEIPDKLNRFNLQDGLVCLNSDQPGGRQCHDYQTRYWCNGKFTAFQNLDTPTGSGDWEPRSSRKDVCSNSTWMQARYQLNGAWVYVNAPADRLAEFDANGLVCFNSDQSNGQCSNYVVKFECP